MEIFNITKFVEFKRAQPFKQFAENVITARREADSGGSLIKGTVQKLQGNSGYGTFYKIYFEKKVKIFFEKILLKKKLKKKLVKKSFKILMKKSYRKNL